jgi:hypothetical protein
VSQYADIFAALAAPFENDEVKQRKGPGNRMLDYVTARTTMNRLDDVLGPENWWDEFVPLDNSVVVRLSIRLPDGTVLTKTDAGGFAGMEDAGDNEKSGFSDGFKRVAVKFGVGRYLYRDGIPNYASRILREKPAQEQLERMVVLAGSNNPVGKPTPVRAPEQAAPFNPSQRLPQDGQQFYPWSKSLEDHYQIKIQPKIRELCEVEGISTTYKDWDMATTNAMVERVIRFCRRLSNYDGKLDEAIKTLLEGSRSALYAQATLLFAETYPGTQYSEQQIHELIAGISEDKISNLQECKDLEILRATTILIRDTIAANRKRRNQA